MLFLYADADIWLTREANRVTGEQERKCTETYWEAESSSWLANVLYEQSVIQRNDHVGSSGGLEQTVFCIRPKHYASVTVMWISIYIYKIYIYIPSNSPNWTFFSTISWWEFSHTEADMTIPYP